jgi:hypothetical protein
MKASELIKLVQDEVSKHGDLEISFFYGTTPNESRDVFYEPDINQIAIRAG